MPRDTIQPVNIGSIARGAAIELFEKNMLKIAQNIADTSTDALAKRTLVLTFTFEPDADRQACNVVTDCKLKLASVTKHKSRAFLGKDTSGRPYVFPTDPRQEMLFEPPAEEEKLLQFNVSNRD